MHSPLLRLLKDFSEPKAAEAPITVLLKPAKPAPKAGASTETPAVPKPDPAAERAEAIRKAVEAARAEERELAEQRLAAAIEAEKARHQDELAAERLLWAETEGAQLGDRFGSAFQALETLVSDRVANILAPFLEHAYQGQMIAELRGTVRSMVSEPGSGILVVSGPEDLLAALKKSLGSDLEGIEFKVSESVDVSVVASDTAIDTLLQPWSDRLRDVFKAV